MFIYLIGIELKASKKSFDTLRSGFYSILFKHLHKILYPFYLHCDEMSPDDVSQR